MLCQIGSSELGRAHDWEAGNGAYQRRSLDRVDTLILGAPTRYSCPCRSQVGRKLDRGGCIQSILRYMMAGLDSWGTARLFGSNVQSLHHVKKL
jgi:hypothetical protein